MTGPTETIRTCLAKSFQFKGRATRSEFWWFAPVGLVIGLVGSWLGAASVDEREPLTLLLLAAATLASFTPLAAAGSRRLQDSGENGQDIFLPMMPLLFLTVFFSVVYHVSLGLFVTTLIAPPVGFLLAFFYWFALVAALVLAPLAGLFFLGPVIGQLLVASDPASNSYGPNPKEVHS